jgi:acetyltransferase
MEALDEVLPPAWSHNNPIDILGDARPSATRARWRSRRPRPGSDGCWSSSRRRR